MINYRPAEIWQATGRLEDDKEKTAELWALGRLKDD